MCPMVILSDTNKSVPDDNDARRSDDRIIRHTRVLEEETQNTQVWPHLILMVSLDLTSLLKIDGQVDNEDQEDDPSCC